MSYAGLFREFNFNHVIFELQLELSSGTLVVSIYLDLVGGGVLGQLLVGGGRNNVLVRYSVSYTGFTR